MAAGWSGLVVRRMEHGQTPIADFYCARCHTHRRVTGRDRVRDYLRANPITDHRAHCPANQKGTTP